MEDILSKPGRFGTTMRLRPVQRILTLPRSGLYNIPFWWGKVMLESLSERLQKTLRNLKGEGRVSEKHLQDSLREIRLALLEADVNFRVVKDFVARLKEKALGQEVLRSLTPGQQVVKIVRDELVELLGRDPSRLRFAKVPPTAMMLVGLQGSGKTTTTGKLALWLRKKGRRPLMVSTDVYRPAAMDQLRIIGEAIRIPVFASENLDPVERARLAYEHCRSMGYDLLLVDTAGRLQIDQEMMDELRAVKQAVKPNEVLLVADAMTGQEAVNVAAGFNEHVGLTGLILTKVDGDARGGAAISMRAVTGVPIKFLGTGEKTNALEVFHPDRLADRILGMGDVLTLIERAEAAFDQEQLERMERKVREASFDLEDFLEQFQQIRHMGPLSQILDMIPGMGRLVKDISPEVTDRQFKRVEAIILSMTPEERRKPRIINSSRKKRIARGSGTTVQEVNALLKQFRQMQRVMKQLSKGQKGMRGLTRMFG